MAVEISLDREFDYLVPARLQGRVQVGTQVLVPFHGRRIRGFVVGLSASSDFRGELKEIADLVHEKPLIPENVMALARWIADYYCAPLESAVRTVLPGIVRRPGARHKRQRMAALVDPPPAEAPPLSPLQQEVVRLLQEEGTLPVAEITQRLNCSESPLRTLEKYGWLSIGFSTVERTPDAEVRLLPTQPLELMPEQRAALELIREEMDAAEPRPVLLHGVTGSGKTEVYLQAIRYALDKGRTAVVLVPEIALTPQTVDRFRARFGDTVAVLHSGLSDGERHDEWHRLRDGRARIAVGARSALFAPLENLGLIVVDEEHEPSYKQDKAPRYNARDAAVMRGRLEGCCVVLGSATPSLESVYNVRRGRYRLARMTARVDHRAMPRIRVVDMCLEAERTGKPQLFSAELLDALHERLRRGEQTILFLNRRGFASSLLCRQCGFVPECPHCSLSLTYHKRRARLACHLCGAELPVPERCPECGSPDFKYAGLGTERIEEVLCKLLPRAAVVRMDSDTTRGKDAHRRILDDFRRGRIDILLGTQMIAKGLDFPNVTLVGVLYADISLHLPDFRAGERTFQLLVQVAGRAGRGEKAGEVIIQTYSPHHPAIQAARTLDFDRFCAEDLEFREQMGYPPFRRLVLVTFRGAEEPLVARTAAAFREALQARLPETVTCSPALPAPVARVKGRWIYQVILQTPRASLVTRPLRRLLADVRLPAGVTCSVDVDALSLL